MKVMFVCEVHEKKVSGRKGTEQLFFPEIEMRKKKRDHKM
jgi:hypothetical protein